MKKAKSLIITFVILLLLLIALYCIKAREKDVTPITNEPTALAEADTANQAITIVDYTTSDIKEITISKGNETLTYVPTGEGWSIKEYEQVPVSKNSLQYVGEQLLHIEASQSIDSTNLSDFGLDKPMQTVVYSLKNGTTVELLVGASTLDHTNSYVTFKQENSPVYIISSLTSNAFITNINDLRDTKLEEYEPANVTALSASGREITNISLTPSEEQNSLLTSFDLTTPSISKLPVDYDRFQALLDALPTFTIKEFIADNVTDLSQYGLDNPQLHLCLQVTSQETAEDGEDKTTTSNLDYIWGDEISEGLVAFMKTGDKSVYAMDSSFLKPLIEALDPFTLSSKYIGLVKIDTLSGVDIFTGKGTYHFSIDEANETYAINDKPIEKDSFKAIYTALVNIKADKLMEEETVPASSPAAIRFTYTFLDGKTTSYNFYNASSNQFLITRFKDAMTVGCSTKQFEYLESLIEKALAN